MAKRKYADKTDRDLLEQILDTVIAIAKKVQGRNIIVLAFWLAFSASGMAQDDGSVITFENKSISTLPGCHPDLGLTLDASGSWRCATIQDLAGAELAKDDPASKRLAAQIAEAKDLLREKAKIEKRIADIGKRLVALDNDAEPLAMLNEWSGSITLDNPCSSLVLTPGGTYEYETNDLVWRGGGTDRDFVDSPGHTARLSD